jgi:predicted nucleotidyltransferase
MGCENLLVAMSLLETVHERKEEIQELASKHGAGNVRIFGRAARGEDHAGSDLDFLIDIVGPTSSWFPSGLALDLEDLLGRRVDVVTEKSLHWVLREKVLREARPI